MLQFEGFKKVEIIDKVNKCKIITVKYHVESKSYLDNYINNHSKKMRDEGLSLFKSSFKASRKVYPLNHS